MSELDFDKLRGPRELKEAAKDIHADDGQVRSVTVRELLSWFKAERRGKHVVARVRRRLKEARLTTIPDFEGAWIDGNVRLVKAPVVPKGSVSAPAPIQVGVSVGEPTVSQPTTSIDPAHQLSKLAAANRAPVRVTPDATIDHAVTLMMNEAYSQLPVMTSDREVKGMISWKSIAIRAHLGKSCKHVRDCMDEAHILPSDRSIFDAIKVIAEHDFVLVRDTENRISGIVTSHDVSEQFNQLTAPFLLLGEIETHIRHLLSAKFSKADLAPLKESDDDKDIESVTDLTFGQYCKLLENPRNWELLDLKLDRKVFVAELDKVRQIRNEVMHFDPDGITEEHQETLQQFARFLAEINKALKN